MQLSFHPSALEEFEAAVQWYEEQERDLGRRFYEEVRRKVAQAARFPRSAPQLALDTTTSEVRVFALRLFPYVLVTAQQNGSDPVVVAVAHSSRRPRYWEDRSER